MLNWDIDYGGREEIDRATIKWHKEGVESTVETFDKFLDTKGQADPDIVIRTGGEHRLSGYLSWQLAYAELFFPNFFLPDFDEVKMDELLEEFSHRHRRFGK